MRDLESIGMKKGLLYETIITTEDINGKPNAAPIGVICKGKGEIIIFLHEGSHTLENIKVTKRFVVNILKDPTLFVKCTVGDLSIDYFDKYKSDFYIKNTEAFFRAMVTDFNEIFKKDELGPSRISIIKAEVDEIIKKVDYVEPLNRAIFAVIEALIYLTRIDVADAETSKVYLDRIREMSRIVNRVGGLEHKKAMKNILDAVDRNR